MDIKILIVDDDKAHRQMLDAVLSAEGYQITHAEDGALAVEAVRQQFYDLILMDIKMKQMSGIEALGKIKQISPEIPIILMTAYASVSTAVEALKSKADDYLIKPIDIEELKLLIAKTLRVHKIEKENLYLKECLDERFDFSNIIGSADCMKQLFETICLVAPTDATILILGESGTGKELIASAIHQNSPRKERPMIKLNCAALPETLLESELFGFQKGAFTGALTSKPGRFKMADGSSIFLDEIAEMSPTTQAKILRVLQEREFEQIGGSETIQVDIRVIAATNKNLEDKIKEGDFREDLYYRLNVVTLTVPPLRDRREDIPLLSELFLKKYTEKNRRLIKDFLPETIDLFMRYDWPGNVRELENIVERAVIMARENRITPKELPDSLQSLRPKPAQMDLSFSKGKSLKEVEALMIKQTLDENGGNRTHTANILGISRRTLQLKLKELGIN